VTVLLDTGPLVAAWDRADKDHVRCAELLESLAAAPDPLVVPAPVVVEVCWLLEKFLGPAAEADFLDVIASGEIELEPITKADAGRMAELVRQYSDFPLGAVDASMVAVAERLKVHRLATLDRRHFPVVRPRHVEAFALLP
jgi:predicted nucleic acid-binding protein